VGNFRTRTKAVDKLVAMVQGASDAQELAIVHSTTPDEAQNLKIRLSSFVDIITYISPGWGRPLGCTPVLARWYW